jgi:thiol-disulfide isomerase/thioredoxin
LIRAVWGVIATLAFAAAPAIADEPAATIPTAPAMTAADPSTGAAVAIDPSLGPMQVTFLATWCQPCMSELPRLADLEDRWKPDGLRLILVAVATRQTPERLREFLGQGPLPGRLLFDADGSVARAFGATTIPLHVLVDRRGRIVARANALDSAFAQAVERLVRQEGRAGP